ncbi:MAG: hypothetical protein H0A76_02175 [Candidatus Thiodubiliella endoseptemdiera]|uniref:Uncharacterized protein n=1 Tax=Candidatus Thiodubiliella endoseptemdiera TaxID=2738886 RepID=A0A853EZP9_9GAMM|nr:hypothetical protein [Candidatus Thiodubiliella endoseptemdiera]
MRVMAPLNTIKTQALLNPLFEAKTEMTTLFKALMGYYSHQPLWDIEAMGPDLDG